MKFLINELLYPKKVYPVTEGSDSVKIYELRYKIYMLLSFIFVVLGLYKIFRPINL